MRLALTGAAALLLTTTGALAQTLTISTYGIAQDGFKKHLYAPFEAQCGCKLVVEVGNSGERVAKLDARKANPEVDVIAFTDFDALDASNKGLTEAIDAKKLTNYGKLYEFARDPIGGNKAIGYTYYSTSIAYRSDKVKIESWADLAKPELKGRVALPNITTSQAPLTLFMIDKAVGGKTPDLAAGIDFVGKMKGDVTTFYERGSQLPQLLQQEEIYAAVLGRFGWAGIKKLGMPIAWATPKEGQSGGINVLSLVKGSKNQDLAYKFIDFWLSTEVQTKLAQDLIDSPVNAEVKLDDAVAENLTYGADTAKSLSLVPPAQLLEQRKAWVDGWNAKVAR